jgi:hypothetical protein
MDSYICAAVGPAIMVLFVATAKVTSLTSLAWILHEGLQSAVEIVAARKWSDRFLGNHL